MNESVKVEIISGNSAVKNIAKKFENKDFSSAYLFIKNYKEYNLHIRRVQASVLFERYLSKETEKTRSGNELDAKHHSLVRNMFAIDIIGKTCMQIDDLVTILENITKPDPSKGICDTNSYDSVGILDGFKDKTFNEKLNIFSLPDVEQLSFFNSNEKTNIISAYKKHFYGTSKLLEKLGEFRKKYKYLFLKSKHGLPIFLGSNEIKLNDKSYYVPLVLRKENEKIIKYGFIISEDLVKRSFNFLCKSTEFIDMLLTNKLHELETNGFRQIALNLYNQSEQNLAFLEKMSAKQRKEINPHRVNVIPKLDVPISNTNMKKMVDDFENLLKDN